MFSNQQQPSLSEHKNSSPRGNLWKFYAPCNRQQKNNVSRRQIRFSLCALAFFFSVRSAMIRATLLIKFIAPENWNSHLHCKNLTFLFALQTHREQKKERSKDSLSVTQKRESLNWNWIESARTAIIKEFIVSSREVFMIFEPKITTLENLFIIDSGFQCSQ